MYFILSKVLLFVLCPILWVFALLMVTILAKNQKHRKRFFLASIVILYIFSIPLVIGLVSNVWDVKSITEKQPKVYSCAIVLGGFASDAGNGSGYFNGAADRFIQGIRLLSTGKVTHILVTGGNGALIPGQFREGAWVKTQLEELKVPDSSILIENNSRNTFENAVFSKAVLQKAGLKPPYLLVTSSFHMRRAYMLFKHQGYDVTAYPCNFYGGIDGFSFSDLVPDAGALAGWNTYLKEMVGYVIDYWKK